MYHTFTLTPGQSSNCECWLIRAVSFQLAAHPVGVCLVTDFADSSGQGNHLNAVLGTAGGGAWRDSGKLCIGAPLFF
jgi:hypothetical protein